MKQRWFRPWSFQARITLAFALGFFGLLVASLGVLAWTSLSRLKREEARELNTFAGRILAELQAGGIAVTGAMEPPAPDRTGKPKFPGRPSTLSNEREPLPSASPRAQGKAFLPPNITDDINQKLSFIFKDEDMNLGYAIYDDKGRRVYTYYRTKIDPFAAIERLYPGRGAGIFRHTYKDWFFFKRCQIAGHSLLVTSFHHLGLIDHILVAVAMLLPPALLVSLMLGASLARIVVAPLEAIANTAHRIKNGQLDARISPPRGGKEVADLARTLNSTFEQLEQSFRRIEEFSAAAAHELKTPLTAIRGNLEVGLRKPRSPQEYRETLTETIDDIGKLQHILADLLLLARTNVDGAIPMSTVNFSETVIRSVDFLDVVAAEAGVTLQRQVSPDIHIQGHAGFLDQLCYNLIENAIKFSPRGGTVKVRLKREDQCVSLSVEDQGIGITPDEQERIFDPFYQVSACRSRGTGLGLAVVKWIASVHHGTVRVDSEVEVGSTFTFELAERAL